MRVITGFIFLLNIAAWIGANVLCWNLTGSSLGVTTIVGILVFLIAWAFSGEMVLAPIDFLMQPDWGVFVIKLKWSNMAGLFAMGVFLIICLIFDWFDIRAFLDVNV